MVGKVTNYLCMYYNRGIIPRYAFLAYLLMNTFIHISYRCKNMSATASFTNFTLGKYHFKYHMYEYTIMTEHMIYSLLISKNMCIRTCNIHMDNKQEYVYVCIYIIFNCVLNEESNSKLFGNYAICMYATYMNKRFDNVCIYVLHIFIYPGTLSLNSFILANKLTRHKTQRK